MSGRTSGIEQAAYASRMSVREYAEAVASATGTQASPYDTGICPGCGGPVEFEQLDATQPGGYRETVRGRWKCRIPECQFGEAA